jgi:hypothetical protein
MHFKVKDNHKEHVLEAVKSYMNYLANNEYNSDYTESIRFLLNKLHRESDWSYVLWPLPNKNEAGKIIVEESTSGEFPRGSEWTLYHNGILKLNALFKSKSLNLYDLISNISLIKTEHPFKKTHGVLAQLTTANRDTIQIAATEGTFKVLERISNAVIEKSFATRTTSTLAVLDSIQFFLETKLPDETAAASLIKIRDQMMESYNIKPLFVKLKQKEQNANSDKVNITLKEDSLRLIIESLQQYCEIMEKFHGPSIREPSSIEGEKIGKIRHLLHSLKTGLGN